MNPVDAVPIVGQPSAYALGFLVLIFVAYTDSWARSLVTVAHEGGHIVVAIITGADYGYFYINETSGGGATTNVLDRQWSLRNLLNLFSGYPMPSLLGLGGAALIRHGQAWSVLWAALVLLLAAFFQAGGFTTKEGPLALVFTLLAFLGVGFVILDGSPAGQAAAAVGLVWWLLVGGAYSASIGLSRGPGSDAAKLAEATLVPAVVWHAVWAFIGIAALFSGGRHLLHH